MLNLDTIDTAKKEVDAIVSNPKTHKAIKLKIATFNALYESMTDPDKELSQEDLESKLEAITVKHNEIKDLVMFEESVMNPDLNSVDNVLDFIKSNNITDTNITDLVNQLLYHKEIMDDTASDERYTEFRKVMDLYKQIVIILQQNPEEEEMKNENTPTTIPTTVEDVATILNKPEAFEPVIVANARLVHTLKELSNKTDLRDIEDLTKKVLDKIKNVTIEGNKIFNLTDTETIYFADSLNTINMLLKSTNRMLGIGVTTEFACAYADLIILNEYGQMNGLADTLNAFKHLLNERNTAKENKQNNPEEDTMKNEDTENTVKEEVAQEAKTETNKNEENEMKEERNETMAEKIERLKNEKLDRMKDLGKKAKKKAKKSKAKKEKKAKGKKKDKKSKQKEDDSCCSTTTKVIIGIGIAAAAFGAYNYLGGDIELED